MAKQTLCKMLEDTDGQIHKMKPDDVYRLSPAFQEYEFSHFKTNLAALKKRLTKESQSTGLVTKSKAEPWRYSEAKSYLTVLLETDSDGIVHHMDAHDVYNMSELFKPYEFHNFKTNLEKLKENLKKESVLVQADEQALLNDRAVVPQRELTHGGYPFWHRSNAKQLLARDVREKKHEEMKPRDLHGSRPEYQEFPLAVFSKHISQESYAQSGRSYWMHKKHMKNEVKKHARKLK
jgi:hypothetical protein